MRYFSKNTIGNNNIELSKIQQLLTLDNVLCLILTIYCSINALCTLYTSAYFQEIREYSLFICLIVSIITFIGLKYIFKKIDKISLKKNDNFNKDEFLIYSLLNFEHFLIKVFQLNLDTCIIAYTSHIAAADLYRP